MFVFFPSQTVMEAMGLIAIIVNCYLIGQCGQLQRLFPWLSPEMAIISIVILEVTWHLHRCLSEEHRAVSYQTFALIKPAFCDPEQYVCNQKMTELRFILKR